MKTRHSVGSWFAALRPFSFPASLLPLLVATAAVAPLRNWNWWLLAVEAAAVVILHSIGNLLNDYFDYKYGADTREQDDTGRPGRFLVNGTFTPGEYFGFATVLFAALMPLGAILIWRGGWPIAVITTIGFLGGYAYTGAPFRFKSRMLGDLCIFVVFGPAIAAGASWMQVGSLDPKAMALSVPIGMLVTAILAANNLRDLEEDAAGGVRTLAQRIGRKLYSTFVLILLFGPPVILIALVLAGKLSPWILIACLALPLGFGPARDAVKALRRPDADVRTAKYQTLFSLLALIGLIIGS